MELKNIDKSNWKKYKFSDLVTNINEKVIPCESGLEHYIGLKHLDAGSLKIRRFGETSSLIGNKLKIYKGDFILAKRNAYLKRVSIADFDAVASAHSFVLRAKEEYVLKEFMPFFLLSEYFWARAIQISVGSLSPTINWKTLSKQEFLLPPKDQQAQIAKLLWAMNDVIELNLNILNNLIELDFSSLKHYFYDDKLSERIQLKKIVLTKKGKKPSLLKDSGEGLPYCNANYLRTGEIDSVVPKDAWASAVPINENDILVLWDGSNAGEILFGRKGFLSSTMCKLDIINDRFNKDFIFHFLRFKTNDIKRATVGSAIPHVDPGMIQNIKIPKLLLSEQESIVKHFEIIKKTMKKTEIKIKSSKSLLKSIINQMF